MFVSSSTGLSPGFWSTAFSGPMEPVSPGALSGQTSSVRVASPALAIIAEASQMNIAESIG